MRAAALARIERHGDRDEIVERSAVSPLAIRSSGGRVLLASTAAAPVGGDELDVTIAVGAGAHADVGSVAAMVVWPGPSGAPSLLRTTCDVGAGGHLDLVPEPVVAVAGSRHRSITRVHLAERATCCIVEEASLGRTGEPTGDLALSLRVERSGRVLVHHDERFAPDLRSSVSVGAARHVVSVVMVGIRAGGSRTVVDRGRAGSRLPLADDAVLVLALGGDRPAVSDLLADLAPELSRLGDRR